MISSMEHGSHHPCSVKIYRGIEEQQFHNMM